ncbi:MAG: phenylalanine--tRNA ligase beta subunit-related protein [Candidatus Hadarchaeota archaeon]
MKLDPKVREKYPEFIAGYVRVSGVTMEQTVEALVERKREVFSDLKTKYGAVNVLEIPEAKAYRSFFKQMGADPSSYRPAPEFLLRRALDDRFPTINNIVDVSLLTTVEHWISTGVYDILKMKGEAKTTLAEKPEPIELIDGRKLITKAGEVILRDDQKILSAYTLGDSKFAKISHEASSVLYALWNAPGVGRDRMEAAINSLSRYARKFCGGHVDSAEII